MIETFLAFAVTAAYWPGIPGAAITPRWALLSIIVPASLLALARRRPKPNTAAWVGLSLLIYAAVSLSWTTSLPDGLNAFWQLLLLAGCAWIGALLPSLARVYLGVALGMGLTSGIIVLEVLGWDVLHQLTQLRPGLFFNPNIVTETATLAFVACFASRQYWASLLPLPALILTHSRGGMAALAIAAVCWAWKRSPFLAMGFAGAIFFGTIGMALNNNVVPNNDEFRAGIEFNSQSVRDRLNIWRDTVWGLTWRGTGIGSYRSEFLKAPYHTDDLMKGRADNAHNDFLEMAYELGIVGICLFIVLLSHALWSVRGSDDKEPEKIVLIAFIVEAVVQFPFHMPVTGALAALCLGHLLKRSNDDC